MLTLSILYKIAISGDRTYSATFEWSPAEPLILRATFQARGELVDWIFSRELVAAGLCSLRPIGDGDVTVKVADPWTACMHLSTPEGDADVLIPSQELGGFLLETETVVPTGSPEERARVFADIDAHLALIMREAA